MKTIEKIYEEMLSVFRSETGVEAAVTSDLSVRLYAVAAQVYGLYAQVDWLSKQCFPQTAEGEWLDRHAALRGLERQGPLKAEGQLLFSLAAPAATTLFIPAGTVCTTVDLIRFETTQEAALWQGMTSVQVPARAIEPGKEGNVPGGSILVMTSPPVGVSSCVNPDAFTGGTDMEDDESLRQRVLESYRRMPNGANAAFYEQVARSFPEVSYCCVLPRNRGKGTVDVVIESESRYMEEGTLEKIQARFDELRELAVDVMVSGSTVAPKVVAVNITVEDGYDPEEVKLRVRTAIRNFFNGALMGQDVPLARLYHLVYPIEGVKNCKFRYPEEDMVNNGNPARRFDLRQLVVNVVEALE